jgi:hypothetical protein
MPSANRSQDDGRTLRAYFDRVLVRCPRCDRLAIVGNIEAWGTAENRPYGTYRLQCESCTHRAEIAPTWYVFGNVRGRTVDPFFQAPLFLQRDTRLGTVFAYNEAHLEWLEQFIRADLRERTHLDGHANSSMASRLPRWMKLAKNRDAMISAIDQLRASLVG